ncbi:MAG: class I SAM-dependent methyltransferase [Zetaproteobacteria bacterium]|nr:MAG: class I SAM-dependent methyltransferase [Zetaproteobacteria bacterium]
MLHNRGACGIVAAFGETRGSGVVGFYSELAEYYEAVFPYRDEVYAFLRQRVPAGGRRILDAGCGTGHYCGRFAVDGFDAVGIDLDPQMIDVARRNYPTPAFRCLNLLDAGTLSSPFDLAFCIGNVAPHLTQDEFARFVGSVENILRPGGVWIFQIVNWDYVLAQGSYPFRPRTLGDGRAVFLREYRDVSESRVRFLTRLAEADRTIFEGDVWLYPLRTEAYLRLHCERGFELLDHFSDFQRTAYAATTDAGSVFVFRKAHPAASTAQEQRRCD